MRGAKAPSRFFGDEAMHCVIAILYGFIIWFSVLAYVLIVGGSLTIPLLVAPFIISGAALFIILVDLAMFFARAAITKLFKSRAANAAPKDNYELESTAGTGNKSR